ncbi:MAG: hypothetical protein OZSIB_1334 [Candidatus Ozemobacter sibiricus]|uniref:Uncharacterized protein n=1 Tax=Candidatus Ozemobacter sibiricus TaxID=2268124 RepID=A0A367ZMJ3_9BACT|nr:MAG: hypothetical protein OZSIB_1334 [Candidatus Ozemobacter sibiricus]
MYSGVARCHRQRCRWHHLVLPEKGVFRRCRSSVQDAGHPKVLCARVPPRDAGMTIPEPSRKTDPEGSAPLALRGCSGRGGPEARPGSEIQGHLEGQENRQDRGKKQRHGGHAVNHLLSMFSRSSTDGMVFIIPVFPKISRGAEAASAAVLH